MLLTMIRVYLLRCFVVRNSLSALFQCDTHLHIGYRRSHLTRVGEMGATHNRRVIFCASPKHALAIALDLCGCSRRRRLSNWRQTYLLCNTSRILSTCSTAFGQSESPGRQFCIYLRLTKTARHRRLPLQVLPRSDLRSHVRRK